MVGINNNGEALNLLTELSNYVKAQTPQAELALVETFADRFFAACSYEDLKDRSLEELYATMYSVWQFSRTRAKDEVKIRIFNPSLAEDGFESTHTVIEISHDDIPFLVDSTRMVLNRYGFQIHFIVHFGGMKVVRDQQNHITQIYPLHAAPADAATEAPIYFEIDRLLSEKLMGEVTGDIDRVLNDVRLAVADWSKMRDRAAECLAELQSAPANLDEKDIAETRDFLSWLINNNFTFLGARDYKLIGDGTSRALQLVPGSGLGVLRDESNSTSAKSYAELPPQARKMALSKNILIVAKTNTKSTVHRDTYTDYIGVKVFDKEGKLVGERRFIGLYTSTAYSSSPRQIPFLRHKVEKILDDLGYPPMSHDGKEAAHILETLPRDDLLQASVEELLDLTKKIIQLKERKRVRLLVRRDAFYRYFSCLVYVPRDIFTTNLALTIRDILMEAFKGQECNYTTYFSDSVLARIHYLIRVHPKTPLETTVEALEKQLIAATRSWPDELKDQLIKHFGEADGLRYYQKYARTFPASYSESYSAQTTISDIEHMEALLSNRPITMSLANNADGTITLKLFHLDQPIVLSDVLPILENMGLRIIAEHPHELKFKDGRRIWLHDFTMTYLSGAGEMDIKQVAVAFEEAFIATWFGGAENDGFNRLIVGASLTWQQTAMLRAYTKYLRQIGFLLSQTYIEQALISNVEITKQLVELFNFRFDPNNGVADRGDLLPIVTRIEAALEKVVSLDEDRIIRRLLEIQLATIRTNYFQKTPDGTNKSYISFKFDPELISDLPLPRPRFEIFVYSPRVEGIHLRAGKVARGGLRWSDRREDFRTEVLGLMKAQQVKNTVIVPEGAKGGFVVKQATPDMGRDAYLQEGIACYSIFISGLLDITDNIKEGKIIPPTDVVRFDNDDPYLVVAADKGTATFSDIANGIATRYGFWLDDAFASGGSVGYDHKKMGITSRGAWVSVVRHFRELGLNPEVDDFTVVGIGDMSGDVFGNGMLLSKHIKLLGAFNHVDIFVDPNPNPEKSFEERKRLFNLPRSSWRDYNPELISAGGGVFSRSAKSIRLTPEMKAALHTDKDTMVPNELIRAILQAPVDLIWNGGIGTFVKASTETHLDVGDRTNDGIRLDATEVNARSIAEGGNLGLTQAARIEYSLRGGIVNTDFIDNSAGVDCSDHEVNMKILLNRLITDGKMTYDGRNQLMEAMTDEVATLVLMDNYDQTLMLSLEASVARQTLDLFRQYMNDLEKQGRLNRQLERLPTDKALLERKANDMPLTRPEIAMLLAYCKMYLKQDILTSDVPEDPYYTKFLLTAFPKQLGENYYDYMQRHSLRREIIATQLCKSITDRMGINFVERLQRETGASTAFIIRAFSVAERIYGLEEMWHDIQALNTKVEQATQFGMMLKIYYVIRRATRWVLRNRKPNLNIQETIDLFTPPVQKIAEIIPSFLNETDRANYEEAIADYVEKGVPEALATRMAVSLLLFTSLDIAEAARKAELDLPEVAEAYYILGNRLELNWVKDVMNQFKTENPWDELARSGFRDDLERVQRLLTTRVLTMKSKEAKDKSLAERIETWLARQPFFNGRWVQLIAEIKSTDTPTFVTYSVALRELVDFVQAS